MKVVDVWVWNESVLPDFENFLGFLLDFELFFPSISVTGPLSEQQIAYVSRETLQVA